MIALGVARQQLIQAPCRRSIAARRARACETKLDLAFGRGGTDQLVGQRIFLVEQANEGGASRFSMRILPRHGSPAPERSAAASSRSASAAPVPHDAAPTKRGSKRAWTSARASSRGRSSNSKQALAEAIAAAPASKDQRHGGRGDRAIVVADQALQDARLAAAAPRSAPQSAIRSSSARRSSSAIRPGAVEQAGDVEASRSARRSPSSFAGDRDRPAARREARRRYRRPGSGASRSSAPAPARSGAPPDRGRNRHGRWTAGRGPRGARARAVGCRCSNRPFLGHHPPALIRFGLTSRQLECRCRTCWTMKKDSRGVDQQREQVGRPPAGRARTGCASKIALRRENSQIAVRRRCAAFSIRAASAKAPAATAATMRAPARCRAASPTSRARAAPARPPATERAPATSIAGSGCRRRVASRVGDQVERRRQDQQDKARAEPAAGEAERHRQASARARPRPARRPHRGFHQLLGGEFLDQRQQIAARPSRSGHRASARSSRRSKPASCSALLDQQGLAVACPPATRRAPSWIAAGARSIAGPSRRASPRSSRASAHRPPRRRPSAIARRSARSPRAARRRER